MTAIGVGRVYDADGASGHRVLVDRLWPRGVAKADAPFDEWAKDLAPSNDLRRWYHEDPEARFDEFAARYRGELDGNPAVPEVAARADGLVLVTAAKDPERSHVSVLREVLADLA